MLVEKGSHGEGGEEQREERERVDVSTMLGCSRGPLRQPSLLDLNHLAAVENATSLLLLLLLPDDCRSDGTRVRSLT